VTFFFDNHHPPELIALLRRQGVDAIHLRDQFSDSGRDDVVWMPVIAARGWVLVTGDHRLRSRRGEKPVFRRAQLITFFLEAGFTSKTRRVQIEWMLRQWPAIATLAATARPGDCFLVPQKGKIKKQTAGPDAHD
jgi:PIN domain-containing protein